MYGVSLGWRVFTFTESPFLLDLDVECIDIPKHFGRIHSRNFWSLAPVWRYTRGWRPVV